MDRRAYLATIGIVTGTALAGCSGETGGNNSSGTGSDSNNGGNATNKSSGDTSTTSGGPTTTDSTETAAPATETSRATKAETATETKMETNADTTQAGTVTTSGGGGTGSAKVTSSELVVDEGEYITDIYMKGIVKNTGSGVLRLPEARVSFYDDSDSILDSSTTTINFLKSDTKWKVNVPYLDENKPTSGEIEVTSTDVFQTKLGIPDALKIVEEDLQTGEEPSLSLKVKNSSNNTVSPAVFCVFYDKDGVAIGDGLDSLDQLPAGKSWQTSLDFVGYSTQDATKITDYDLYANTT